MAPTTGGRCLHVLAGVAAERERRADEISLPVLLTASTTYILGQAGWLAGWRTSETRLKVSSDASPLTDDSSDRAFGGIGFTLLVSCR